MCVVVGASVLRQRGRAETAMKNDMNDGLHAVLKVAHSSRGFVKVLILGLYSISVTHDGYTKHCNPGLFGGILSITAPSSVREKPRGRDPFSDTHTPL
jgi:hypothetical protein